MTMDNGRRVFDLNQAAALYMPHKLEDGIRSEELLLTGNEILKLTEMAAKADLRQASPTFEATEPEGGDELSAMLAEAIGKPNEIKPKPRIKREIILTDDEMSDCSPREDLSEIGQEFKALAVSNLVNDRRLSTE